MTEVEVEAEAEAEAIVARMARRRGAGWSHSALEQRPQAAELAQSVTTQHLRDRRGNHGWRAQRWRPWMRHAGPADRCKTTRCQVAGFALPTRNLSGQRGVGWSSSERVRPLAAAARAQRVITRRLLPAPCHPPRHASDSRPGFGFGTGPGYARRALCEVRHAQQRERVGYRLASRGVVENAPDVFTTVTGLLHPLSDAPDEGLVVGGVINLRRTVQSYV